MYHSTFRPTVSTGVTNNTKCCSQTLKFGNVLPKTSSSLRPLQSWTLASIMLLGLWSRPLNERTEIDTCNVLTSTIVQHMQTMTPNTQEVPHDVCNTTTFYICPPILCLQWWLICVLDILNVWHETPHAWNRFPGVGAVVGGHEGHVDFPGGVGSRLLPEMSLLTFAGAAHWSDHRHSAPFHNLLRKESL